MDPYRATQSPHPTIESDEPAANNFNLTFISIHDLSPDARILYSSESIVDVLGYTPDEVVNQSVWDFFPQDELPYAKQYHKHGIEMDQAAMLAYCRVMDRSGQWVGCECCFTVVYDVMVVCTSIYRSGLSSQKRALEAPLIRRMFSSSPRDPRYHMLSHISHKFQQPSKSYAHEPRAALFLNRFTRTLTIMYATNGLEDILGIPSHALQGKSFYYCIAENCLPDAIRCLEQAKGNDSIAYLRFWYRDPRTQQPDTMNQNLSDDSDEDMTTDTSIDQDIAGGVQLSTESDSSTLSNPVRSESSMEMDRPSEEEPQSRTSSGDSMNPSDTHEGIFGHGRTSESSSSSAPVSPDQQPQAIELEAVISCASDGLVVCLRRARPMVPQATQRPTQASYTNGVFAAPWADEPMVPPMDSRPSYGAPTTFAPSLSPQGARPQQVSTSTGGPDPNDFMAAIREQAIFAWALTGINGSLQRFGSGIPLGESIPTSGLPVWQSDRGYDGSVASSHGSSNGSMVDSASSTIDANTKSPRDQMGMPVGNDHRNIFGDPGIKHNRQPSSSKGPVKPTNPDYVPHNNDLPDSIPGGYPEDDDGHGLPDGLPDSPENLVG
ncbi:hypothetical protein B9Z65_1059 [Elsinoe australis]|uniref:PAS domain-containing protein n=1 Tax=Elsinoe australis TaxID=40998 RepID=A0A2P8AI92_9PEZI|nr:hypothetical protein B9Z65_1059 [Elsinoe australis]